jgi:hypothetical protein
MPDEIYLLLPYILVTEYVWKSEDASMQESHCTFIQTISPVLI